MRARNVLADFSVFSKGYVRNPAALFFSLVFPVILIGVFGLIFQASAPAATTLYVQNFDHGSNASVAFLANLSATGAVTISPVGLDKNLSQFLSNHNYVAGLVIPAGFAADVANRTPVDLLLYTSPAEPEASAIVVGAVEGVANGFNLRLAGGTPVVESTLLPVGSHQFTAIDYLVPGLIGFTILTSPMFSLVDISSTYRKEKLFKQLSLTPLTKPEWLASKILFYVILTFLSAGIMVGFGVLAFGAHVVLSWEVLPFLVLGPFLFVSLGMLAGSAAPTPESAAVIGNVITFPMMFLAGTFFPVSSFPASLQLVAHALPLYYIIDGMNSVMLFTNPDRALLDALIVLALSLVFFVAAIVAFRWRED